MRIRRHCKSKVLCLNSFGIYKYTRKENLYTIPIKQKYQRENCYNILCTLKLFHEYGKNVHLLTKTPLLKTFTVFKWFVKTKWIIFRRKIVIGHCQQANYSISDSSLQSSSKQILIRLKISHITYVHNFIILNKNLFSLF